MIFYMTSLKSVIQAYKINIFHILTWHAQEKFSNFLEMSEKPQFLINEKYC